MFGRRYVLSCWRCNTEYVFKRAKKLQEFRRQDNDRCPNCGGYLSPAPLPRTMLTPPPELKEYKVDAKRVNTWESSE